MTRNEESRLLAAARAGDRRALRRVLEGISAPAHRFSQVFCRNREDAEEVLQDVMTAVARNLDGFRGESSLTTWAYTVARNACGRMRRRKVGQPARVASLDEPEFRARALSRAAAEVDPGRQAERKELREAIHNAIAGLPRVSREVVLLRDVEGLPAKQVAKTLGIGERAVKSRLHRARAALRKTLAPMLMDKPVRRSPKCPDTVQLLSRYLEGDLDGGACTRLEKHVSGCLQCGAACEALQAVLRGCREWGDRRFSAAERKRVRGAIREALAGLQ